MLVVLLACPSQLLASELDQLFVDDTGGNPSGQESDSPATERDAPSPASIAVGGEDTPAALPSPDRAGRMIEEIVVTATKREKALRDIAGSVAAISGDSLESMGAQDLNDYLSQVPGVTQNPSTADGSRIAIRGVAPDGATFTLGQTTGTFIGDTPTTDPLLSYITPDLNAFDLQSVEVLKGPQGTLFGGSALNGAIRYIPQPPSLEDYELKAFAQFQTIADGGDGQTWGAAANLPLADSAALRLGAVQRRAPGVIDDTNRGFVDVDRMDQDSLRAQLRWEPLDSLSARVIWLDQESRTHDLTYIDNDVPRMQRANQSGDSDLITAFSMMGANLGYALDWAQLVSNFARLDKSYASDLDASRAFATPDQRESFRARVDQDVVNKVAEVRLVSEPGRFGAWEWLAGVFAQDYGQIIISDGYVPGTQSIPLPLGPGDLTGQETATDNPGSFLNSLGDIDGRELAIFGEATWSFLPRWEATLGLRLFETRTEGVIVSSGTLLLAGGTPTTTSNADVSDRGINPKLSLRHDLTDDIQLYGLAARGFRFGGINIIASTPTENVPPTYDSDTIWSYELGLRSNWLDSSLQVDGVIYHIDWSDTQQQVLTSSGFFSYIKNIGASEVDGLEMAIRWLPPVDGLSLNFNAAYVRGRTRESFATSSGDVPAGRQLPNTPDWQTSTRLAWAGGIGSIGMSAAATWNHFGPGYNDIQNSIEILDYDTLDLNFRLSLNALAGAPELILNLSNLTDERNIVNALYTPGFTDYFANRPRAVDLKLSVAF